MHYPKSVVACNNLFLLLFIRNKNIRVDFMIGVENSMDLLTGKLSLVHIPVHNKSFIAL